MPKIHQICQTFPIYGIVRRICYFGYANISVSVSETTTKNIDLGIYFLKTKPFLKYQP